MANPLELIGALESEIPQAHKAALAEIRESVIALEGRAETAADALGDLLSIGNIRILYGENGDGDHDTMIDGITPEGIDDAGVIKCNDAVCAVLDNLESRAGGGWTDLRVAAGEAEDRAEGGEDDD